MHSPFTPLSPKIYCQRFLVSHLLQMIAAADLTVDGAGDHWGYLSLSNPSTSLCPLSPLPDHSTDGSCTDGKIPLGGGGCALQCTTGAVTGSDAAASCVNTSTVSTGYHSESALGFWKGMCGECSAVTHGRLAAELALFSDLNVGVCGWCLQSAPQERR